MAAWALLLTVFCAILRASGGDRVLVVATAVLRGHTMPLLELARELRGRGHDVRFAAQEEGLAWMMEAACELGGTGEACCAQDWERHGCRDFVSLGELVFGPEGVRSRLGEVLRDPSVLHSTWGMLRDLYLEQAVQTAARLCAFLAPAFPELQAPCEEVAAEEAAATAAAAAVPEGQGQGECAAGTTGQCEAWRPDLMLADIGAVGAAEMAEVFGVPLVLNSPTLLFNLGDGGLGSRHLPGWGSGSRRDMGFVQRCMNAIYPRLMAVALTPDFVLLNQIRSGYGLAPYTSQHAIFRGKRIIVNTALGFEYPRSTPPYVEYVGPVQRGPLKGGAALGRGPRAPQGAALLKWLAAQERQGRSVVAVAFGSLGLLEPMLFQMVLAGLRKHAVLWVVSHDPRSPTVPGPLDLSFVVRFMRTTRGPLHEDVLRSYFRYCADGAAEGLDESLCSNHFSVEEAGGSEADETGPADFYPSAFFVHERLVSLPLVDVLALPSVRTLVSHCGLGSAQEALLARIPLVCLPLFGDQFDVAARVADAGAGVELEYSGSLAHELEAALDAPPPPASVLRGLSDLLVGAGGASRACDLVELALRSGNVPLRALPADLRWPWFQAGMLDVAVLLCAVFACIAGATQYLAGLAGLSSVADGTVASKR